MSAAEGVTLAGFLAARLDEDEAAAKAQAQRGTVVMYTDGEPTQAEAEYFATISPARVLREVAAKRKILALHVLATRHEPTATDPRLADVTCEICGWVSDIEGSACETLLMLAAPYSDHPGYDPRWKPE